MNRLSYTEQDALLRKICASGEDLASVLKNKGLDYEALVYHDEASDRLLSSLPDFVPIDERPRVVPRQIPCVSFFSGAGGLDIGFAQAGFKTIIDVEINRMFCDTLRANGAQVVLGPPYAAGDMNNPDEVIRLLESNGVPRDFPGVFHGGPPCQSFSVAANQRFSKNGEKFKRTGFNNAKLGNLLFCYIHVIAYFKPETFLIENVDGLLTIDGGEQVKRACAILTEAGYDVTPPRIVNAADYGVPQKRLRTLIIGSRIGHFEFPARSERQLPAGCVFKRPLTGVENHVT